MKKNTVAIYLGLCLWHTFYYCCSRFACTRFFATTQNTLVPHVWEKWDSCPTSPLCCPTSPLQWIWCCLLLLFRNERLLMFKNTNTWLFFFLGAHSAAKLHAQNRTEHPAEGRIVTALDAIANGLTLRQAADQFGISKSVLHRYYAKQTKSNWLNFLCYFCHPVNDGLINHQLWIFLGYCCWNGCVKM